MNCQLKSFKQLGALPVTIRRGLSTSRIVGNGNLPAAPVGGLFSSLLHGSEQAKAEGETEIHQHSRLIGRNKYVHEMVSHAVKPEFREQYRAAAERFFTGLAQDPSLKVKLTGSWETLIGPVDNFVHILEYENYGGYDDFLLKMKSHPTLPKIMAKEMMPTLHSRHSQLMSEFAFWPSSPPRHNGGVYELRSYQLIPGRLLEWENAWKRGLEARKRFVQPAGGWFAQVGTLHEVHHLWQYPDLAQRKLTREQAWNVSGWSHTVQETVKLAQTMKCSILLPCSWSTLK